MEQQLNSLDKVMEPETISKNGPSLKRLMSRGKMIQKKFLFFVFLFALTWQSTLAQDVITLKNGDEIQALVQEIGDVEVKYKKFENPNGPNYSLKKLEVFMIKYVNGSRDVFVNDIADKPTKDTLVAATTTPEPTANRSNVQRQAESLLEPLSIHGIRISNSSGVKLSKNEVRDVMKDVPQALKLYDSGKRKRATGLCIMLPGALISITGCVVYFSNELNELPNEDTRAAGTALMVAGLAIEIPGFIITSSGNKRLKQSVNAYNKGIKQMHTSDISLNFGITNSGGIGLVLNF